MRLARALVLLSLLLTTVCGHGRRRARAGAVGPRPLWNLTQQPGDLVAAAALSEFVASQRAAALSGNAAVNITEDFRLAWRLAGNAGVFPAVGASAGLVFVHLHGRSEESALGEGVYGVAGDAVFHRGDYPSEHSTQFLLQGLYFARELLLVGLLHEASGGPLENVRMELTAGNVSASAVLAQLARLGGNLSAPGWLRYDEQYPSQGAAPSSFFFARRQQPCYFVVAARVSSSGEYAEPEWRRDGGGRAAAAGKGRGNPFANLVGLMHSPNCAGLQVGLAGKSLFFSELRQRGRSYAAGMLVLTGALALAMFRQMRRAESSVVAARTSSVAFAMLLLLDAYLLTLHVLSALLLGGAAAFGILAFAQFVLFAVFHIRLFVSVWRADTLVARFLGQQTGHLRLYLWALGTFLLFVNFPVLWSVFLVVFMGFWVPQIASNVLRNTSRQLDWSYIVCGSLARVAPLLYFCGYRHNFLQIRPNPGVAWVCAVLVAAQVAVLAVQDWLGPRSFVPFLFPPPYDFRRPVDALHVGECVICLAGIGEAAIARRDYMAAPCGHVFHAACLEKWMDEKLQCPTCRAPLPAD
jgi:hypothetical protein